MQKKLIALALASAFAAPAFAATSNVDVYGQINMSVESVDDGDDRWNRMVSNNNSFFGFKGSEDLGGGLSAVWQVEMNLNTDGNGTTGIDDDDDTYITQNNAINGTRNTFVGLSSKSWGTVLAGVHDTPYKMATGPLDIFVGTLGDYNAVFGSAGDEGTNSSLFDLRTANTIAYLSPDFSGFNFKAAYVMGGEGNDGGRDTANAYSLSGTYTNGPLFVTAAYEKHNDVGTAACNAGAVCLGFGNGDERDAWKVGASYKFGDFKVGAMYESMDDNSDDIGHNAWMLNGAYAMGAMTFKASYTQAGDVDGDGNNSGAKMYALGMDYALSKRTTVQLTYARIDNDSGGGWGLGQGPTVTEDSDGDTVSGFGLGVRHSF